MKNHLFTRTLILAVLLVWTADSLHAQDKHTVKQTVVFGVQHRVDPVFAFSDPSQFDFLKITFSSVDRPSVATVTTPDIPEIRTEDVDESDPALPKASKTVVVTISSD